MKKEEIIKFINETEFSPAVAEKMEENGVIDKLEKDIKKLKKSNFVWLTDGFNYQGIMALEGKSISNGVREYTAQATTIEEGIKELIKAFIPENPENLQTYEKREIFFQ